MKTNYFIISTETQEFSATLSQDSDGFSMEITDGENFIGNDDYLETLLVEIALTNTGLGTKFLTVGSDEVNFSYKIQD